MASRRVARRGDWARRVVVLVADADDGEGDGVGAEAVLAGVSGACSAASHHSSAMMLELSDNAKHYRC